MQVLTELPRSISGDTDPALLGCINNGVLSAPSYRNPSAHRGNSAEWGLS